MLKTQEAKALDLLVMPHLDMRGMLKTMLVMLTDQLKIRTFCEKML